MTDALRYAGLWRRSLALTMDMALVSVPYLALGTIMSEQLRAVVLTVAVMMAYVWCFSSRWQGTPGMKWLDIKIVDEQGRRISRWRAFAWCVASSAGLLVAMGGMLYLQFAYDIDTVTARIEAGDVAGAQALLGMEFAAFYRMALVAFVGFVVLSVLWSVSIALGKQKAGLINALVGVRFVRSPKMPAIQTDSAPCS